MSQETILILERLGHSSIIESYGYPEETLIFDIADLELMIKGA